MSYDIGMMMCVDIGWSYSSDLWSLGCTLMELYTGHLLFRTHSHMEHLAMMVQYSILLSFVIRKRLSGNSQKKL